MSTTPTHFNCEHCGKRYAWKAALAGKRAKCACGQTINVPAGMAPPPEPMADDDLYDFKEPEVKPTTARPVAAVAQAVPSSGSGGALLAYGRHQGVKDDAEKRGSRFDDFYHAPRDFYWPSGVLAVGFIALMAWALTAGASGAGLVFFSAYITVATVIKTAIMIGAAFVIAPMAGISFGTLWTAVLKLAAIVVMTDAALFWLQEIMEQLGAYPGRGAGRRSFAAVGLINTLMAAAIIGILSKIMFDMDREEVGTFAIPMAILNRILNFIMILILSGVISAIESGAAPTPAPAGGGGGGAVVTTPGGGPPAAVAPPPAPADPPPAPANADVVKLDRFVENVILVRPYVQDAFAYFENDPGARPGVRGRSDRERLSGPARDIADFQFTLHSGRRTLMLGLRQAGARSVHVELARPPEGGAFQPTHLVVEMPYRAEDRARVIELLKEQVSLESVTYDTAKALADQGNKYLTIPLYNTVHPQGK